MADRIISMPKDTVGLIVRGKNAPAHAPDLLAQHADCILPDGAPIGFYGTGNDGSSNAVGLGMDGVVYDFALMSTKRVYYVDFDSAVSYGVISTTLLVTASAAQCAAFARSWSTMMSAPGSFNIVGDNCSTHASKAFIEAGILTDGIPGLDTPDRLYRQLVATLPGKTTSMSGYFGFIPRATGYDIKFRAYTPGPATAVTANRSSFS